MAICSEIDLCSHHYTGLNWASLVNWTHFTKREGLVNCVYKLCPTGMQLLWWCNQVSNNVAYSWNSDCEVCMSIKNYSWRVLLLAVAGKMSWLSTFLECHSNSDVICHASAKTLQHAWLDGTIGCSGTWLVYAAHQWVGLARHGLGTRLVEINLLWFREFL